VKLPFKKKNILGEIRWCPPLSNHVNLNVDAAFFKDQQAGAVAAIV
jgi:hypothetical protein